MHRFLACIKVDCAFDAVRLLLDPDAGEVLADVEQGQRVQRDLQALRRIGILSDETSIAHSAKSRTDRCKVKIETLPPACYSYMRDTRSFMQSGRPFTQI